MNESPILYIIDENYLSEDAQTYLFESNPKVITGRELVDFLNACSAYSQGSYRLIGEILGKVQWYEKVESTMLDMLGGFGGFFSYAGELMPSEIKPEHVIVHFNLSDYPIPVNLPREDAFVALKSLRNPEIIAKSMIEERKKIEDQRSFNHQNSFSARFMAECIQRGIIRSVP